MAREQLTNGASTTLSSAMGAGDDHAHLTSVLTLPSTGQYRIRVDNELMLVTAGASPVTVARAQEGTSATSHVSGAAVKQALTAGALDAMRLVYDRGTIEIRIDGGGSAIGTGFKWRGIVPCDMTLTGWIADADQSGSIVVDVWVEHQVDYPPADADSITAAAPVTITTATKASDGTLTGWTKALAAEQAIWANVDSCTDITQVVIHLVGTRA